MRLMLVENQEPNPTILPVQGREPFVWQTKGDPRGGDVQRLPDTMLDDLSFLEALENGCLRVVNADSEVLAKLAEMNIADRSVERRANLVHARSGVEATLDRRQNRDMVSKPCIGPGPRGQEGGCANAVVRRHDDPGTERPELCSTHEHLADQYFLVEIPGSGPGQTQTTWARTSS